ncbi:hypothetical protein A2U01_0085630, partial [Trifolium medium]|nr:hypothetical protein [Trifolium medium]
MDLRAGKMRPGVDRTGLLTWSVMRTKVSGWYRFKEEDKFSEGKKVLLQRMEDYVASFELQQ